MVTELAFAAAQRLVRRSPIPVRRGALHLAQLGTVPSLRLPRKEPFLVLDDLAQ